MPSSEQTIKKISPPWWREDPTFKEEKLLTRSLPWQLGVFLTVLLVKPGRGIEHGVNNELSDFIYCKAIKKIQLPGVFFLSFLLQITTLIRKISWEIVRLSKSQVVYHLHYVNSMTGFHDSLAHVVRVLVAVSEDAENSASMHHCFHKMFQHGHPRFSSCFSRHCPRTMSDMAYLDNYQA